MRQLRKERGMTQRELCERTGLTHSTVERIDTGKDHRRDGYHTRYTDVDTATRVAKALGVEVEEIRWLLPLSSNTSGRPVREGLTQVRPEEVVKVCPSCFVALPLVGPCGTCD